MEILLKVELPPIHLLCQMQLGSLANSVFYTTSQKHTLGNCATGPAGAVLGEHATASAQRGSSLVYFALSKANGPGFIKAVVVVHKRIHHGILSGTKLP